MPLTHTVPSAQRWENDRDIVRDAQGRVEGVCAHVTPCYLDAGRIITANLDAPDIIGVFPSSDIPRSALAAALYRVHTYAAGTPDEPRKSRPERHTSRQRAATPALDRQPLVRGRSAGVSGTTVSSCRAAHKHKHPIHPRQRRDATTPALDPTGE